MARATLAVLAWLLLTGAPASAKGGCPEGDAGGQWRGTGTDGAGVAWGWALSLQQKGTRLSGRFDWKGSDGLSSTGRVAGQIDCGTRAVELRGKRQTSKRGKPVSVTYRGEIGADWRSISGAWSEGRAGTFTGVKK